MGDNLRLVSCSNDTTTTTTHTHTSCICFICDIQSWFSGEMVYSFKFSIFLNSNKITPIHRQQREKKTELRRLPIQNRKKESKTHSIVSFCILSAPRLNDSGFFHCHTTALMAFGLSQWVCLGAINRAIFFCNFHSATRLRVRWRSEGIFFSVLCFSLDVRVDVTWWVRSILLSIAIVQHLFFHIKKSIWTSY